MTAKIIHTSDWHLGKKLFKRSRIPEQKEFLDWLLDYCKNQQIQFLIIAGDIFDTPNPPNEALDLYFNFLDQISLTGTQTIIISGNHDSANFIQAPSKILKRHNIYIKTRLDSDLDKNIIHLKHENRNYWFKCIPYFRTYELYPFLNDDDQIDSEKVNSIINEIASYWPKELKEEDSKLTIGHHAFGDFAATGSEQVVSVLGLESISLKPFYGQQDYMALGHIHKTQKMSKEHEIYYSGAPIPMRFSETQKKHIIQLTMDKDKSIVEKVEIPVFKHIIQIKADETSITQKVEVALQELKELENNEDAYFEIKLNLSNPNNELTSSLFDKIKEAGHNLLSLIPIYEKDTQENKEVININELNIQELFNVYYKEKFPESSAPPEELSLEFKYLLEDIHHDQNDPSSSFNERNL